jgi:hypothetical protein
MSQSTFPPHACNGCELALKIRKIIDGPPTSPPDLAHGVNRPGQITIISQDGPLAAVAAPAPLC